MALSLSVYRLADREFIRNPPDVNSVEFDQWEAECRNRLLFEAAIGSNGAVHDYWSQPAANLGLRLLARLYEDGLEVSGQELDGLRTEIHLLQRYWIDTVDDSVVTYRIESRRLAVATLADLYRRAESVLAAVRIANRIDGYVWIG